MGKTNGLGDLLFVGGYDYSGDIGSIQKISGGPAALEVTGIDKSAPERIGGERDGVIDFSAWFNDAAGQSHARLSLLPTTDQIVTYFRGSVLGSPAASCVAKQVNYDGARGADASLVHTVNAPANGYGVDWGIKLTAGKKTDTTATDGTAVDYGSTSTAFGGQAFLQVFAFSGTSVTVKLQDSANNSVFADIASAAFTAATGITSERIAFTGTVRRYVRAITTGTFTSATFAVQFTRNETAVAF